jgi:hypothetical protein
MTMVWKAKDLTDEAGAPLATFAPATYEFQGSRHVIYQGFTSCTSNSSWNCPRP